MAIPRTPADLTALRDETALRRVEHLGSAHDGLRTWRVQRWTAVALIPLSLYFVASILWLVTSDRATAVGWLSSPVGALLVILFVLAGLVHAQIGVREVFIDYVHSRSWRLMGELLVRTAVAILGGASVLAVAKLFLSR